MTWEAEEEKAGCEKALWLAPLKKKPPLSCWAQLGSCPSSQCGACRGPLPPDCPCCTRRAFPAWLQSPSIWRPDWGGCFPLRPPSSIFTVWQQCGAYSQCAGHEILLQGSELYCKGALKLLSKTAWRVKETWNIFGSHFTEDWGSSSDCQTVGA